MIDVRDDSYTGRSPCLSCPHRDMGRNKCSMLCLRLAAYNSGEPWEGKPLPYIAPQGKQEEIIKMEENKESEVRDRQASQSSAPAGKPEVRDRESEVSNEQPVTSNEVCVICRDETKKILNKRSQTCQVCYQRWTRGAIVHPTMGVYVSSQPHIKSKIPELPGGKVCVIDGCGKGVKARELCDKHLKHWRHGVIAHPTLGEFKHSRPPKKVKAYLVKEMPAGKIEKVVMPQTGEKHMSKDSKASYYDAGGIETLEIIRAKLTPEQYQGYLLGCSLKYQCRLMHKADNNEERIRDAEKASNYSLWLLEFLKLNEKDL